MKRLFLATLLVLIISAFFVVPAFAADACEEDPSLHEATVASLIAHVQHANEMGHIQNGLTTALTAPLNVAANESLPEVARAGALTAFTSLVSQQAGKGIDTECAEHLLMQAQEVAAAL